MSKMSSANISNFLQGLDAVKQDYTCTVCHELCRDPVTLSTCFHLICSDYFEGLKACGACGVSLEGCTTYVDDQVVASIHSAKALDQMFDRYRQMDTSSETDQSTNYLFKTPPKPTRAASTSRSTETSVHEAFVFNYEEIFQELLKNDADTRNCKEETPIQLASSDMKTESMSTSEISTDLDDEDATE